MFKNDIKIAFRSNRKNKIFAAINISGLALGMTVCLLMLMYVVNEMSYENFQENKKNIYRIAVEWGTAESKMKFAGSMPALAPAMTNDLSEIERAVRLRRDENAILTDRNDRSLSEQNLFFADPGVFEIFSFDLVTGEKHTALNRPMSIVISESMAQKYFADTNPLEKILIYNDQPLEITGIMKDIPANTHLKCDFLVSYSTLETLGKISDTPWNSWGDDFTYALVNKNITIKDLSKKLDQLLLNNTNQWFADRMTFIIQPLTDIHWDTTLRGDIGAKGNLTYVYLFLSAAVFVLFIACFNYVNLSSSKFFDRMKEIGVRKVMGASRLQLLKQFLIESLLIIIISVLIGVVLFEIFYPTFFSYLDSKIVFESSYLFYLFSVVIILIFLVAIIAGGYPSLLLSGYRPIETIRGNFPSESNKSPLRNILITCQFAISIVLILGVIVIYQQLFYMKNTDLGFDKNDVLLITVPYSNTEIKQKYTTLRNEFLKLSDIVNVSSAYTVPGINSRMNMSVRIEGQPADNSITLQILPADYGFVSSLNLQILSGRNFSVDENNSVIINQSAANALALDNPLGTKLKLPGDENYREIIGVVKDFHIQSLHNKINPMLIYINTDMQLIIALRLRPGDHQKTVAAVKDVWTDVLPGSELSYQYLRDTYNHLYDTEEKTGRLFTLFTIMAILISSMGLFGLSSLMIGRRTKEIGIRKVVGASIKDIVILLLKNYTKWVLIANVFAWPLALYVIHKWLQNFAYQINITIWPFLIAGLLALTIAVFAVAGRALQAAASNPVQALRYE